MNETKRLEDTLPIHSDPEIMSGIPVFRGTRVPIQTLFDYLMDGCSVTEFLENFPTVNHDQVTKILEFASSRTLEGAASR
ncbi:MAG: DUF433 domain-containing protein [Candidatus Latescibacteria bacterium]|nr:DUF433 domain-containing protein [Candidatus Latescibacterota bacterium]